MRKTAPVLLCQAGTSTQIVQAYQVINGNIQQGPGNPAVSYRIMPITRSIYLSGLLVDKTPGRKS